MTSPALAPILADLARWVEATRQLDAAYRAGRVRSRVPPALLEPEVPTGDAAERALPASHRALHGAAQGLFYSLPVAFDPERSVGPYLATIDRDEAGEPWRFMDLGALIATQAFGENDRANVEAVLIGLPQVVSRFAHSEYQTELSLRHKAALDGIAPAGTPRHFVVNTGAEAVENAIKAVLLHRIKGRAPDQALGSADTPEKLGLYLVSFEGAFHGRTLGSLAVTHRRKARLGFPTFDWPHVPFPVEDFRSASRTRQREDKSLLAVWELLVTGRVPGSPRPREQFVRELQAIEACLEGLPPASAAEPRRLAASGFVAEARARLDPAVLKRAQRAAGVLVEPVQGEGGLRFASGRFFRCLRLLTAVYGVPLIFDEVQTGWGATGRLWAHQAFDLPIPPDAVTWAKKAQNGLLFVSDELAAFFLEEKKFNTTWEGDSVGMVRLLAALGRLDLEQVQATGRLARAGLDQLARDHRGLVQEVRGAGCLLAFDVVRPDLRDGLRDRAFRRGLILLPAGERTLRFYPRYDMTPASIEEALHLLRSALEDLVAGVGAAAPRGPEVRGGLLEARAELLDAVVLGPADPPAQLAQLQALEAQRYGALAAYPPGVLTTGRRPLLQYAPETLLATLSALRGVAVALRERVSGQLVAFAIGSPLEDHDELGVREDPAYGDGATAYLQAMAASPHLRNRAEVERLVLDAFRDRARALGYARLSTLVELQVQAEGPEWLRSGAIQETVENYLQSGITFVYVRCDC